MQKEVGQKRSGASKNIILVLFVILLAVAPLFIARGADFSGADDKAEKAVAEINAVYKPWFSPIFEPPSGEIESLLFALQAAVGAGIVSYGLVYLERKKRKQDRKDT